MAKTTIGYAHCPECDSVQAVQSDGLKNFINCTECKTFTNYQSKVAKQRIEDKLLKDVSDTLEPVEKTDEPEQTIEEKLETPTTDNPKPKRSLFEMIGDYL